MIFRHVHKTLTYKLNYNKENIKLKIRKKRQKNKTKS